MLGTGPLTCRNESELSKFVSDIEGLTATGGGDCPELRFMGMLKAFDEGYRYGSPMFVFTDASAKGGNIVGAWQAPKYTFSKCSGAYSESSQISKMEFFTKIVND